jgi:hypothetical protein
MICSSAAPKFFPEARGTVARAWPTVALAGCKSEQGQWPFRFLAVEQNRTIAFVLAS